MAGAADRRDGDRRVEPEPEPKGPGSVAAGPGFIMNRDVRLVQYAQLHAPIPGAAVGRAVIGDRIRFAVTP